MIQRLPDSCRCSSWTPPLTSVRSCGPYSTRNKKVRPSNIFFCLLFCFSKRYPAILHAVEFRVRLLIASKLFALSVGEGKRDIDHREGKGKQSCVWP